MPADVSDAPGEDSLTAANDAASPAVVVSAQSLDSAGSSDHGSLHAESLSVQVTSHSSSAEVQSAPDATLHARTQSLAPRLLVQGRPLSAPPAAAPARPTTYSTLSTVALVPFVQIYNIPRPTSLVSQANDLRRTSVSTSAAESEEDASQLARYVHSADYDMRGPFGPPAAASDGASEPAQTEQAGTLDMLASATRTVSQTASGSPNSPHAFSEAPGDDQKRKRERSEAIAGEKDQSSTASASQTAESTAPAEQTTAAPRRDLQQSDSTFDSSGAAGECGPPPAQRRRTQLPSDSFAPAYTGQYTLAQLEEAHRSYLARCERERQEQQQRLQEMQARTPFAGPTSYAPTSASPSAAQTFTTYQAALSDSVYRHSAAYAATGSAAAPSNGARSTFSNDPLERVPAQYGQATTSHHVPNEYNGTPRAVYGLWSSVDAAIPATNVGTVSAPSPAPTSTPSGGWTTSPAPSSTTEMTTTSYRVDHSTSPAEQIRRTPIPIKQAKPTSSKSAAYTRALTADAHYGGMASGAAEIQVGVPAGHSDQHVASPFVHAPQLAQQQQAPTAAVPSASAAAPVPQKKTSGRRAAPEDAFNIIPIAGMKPFICKLRWLVSNPTEVGDVVTWASDGASILVKVGGDTTKIKSVLLRTYAHENANAFCRRFAVYGFTPIKDAGELADLIPTGAAVAEWRAYYDERDIFVQSSMGQIDALKTLVPRKEPKKSKEADDQPHQHSILVTTPQPQPYQYGPYATKHAHPLANLGASTSTSPQGYRAFAPRAGESDQSATSTLYNPQEGGYSVASLMQEASQVPRMGGEAQPMQGLFRSGTAESGTDGASEEGGEAGSA